MALTSLDLLSFTAISGFGVFALGALNARTDRRKVLFEIKNKRDIALYGWTRECLDVIGRIYVMLFSADCQENSLSTRIGILANLCVLIDFGRLYIPNVIIDDFGEHKSIAFQGYRHEALDHLVSIHRIVEGYDPLSDTRNDDWHCITDNQKKFVSQMHSITGPDVYLALSKRWKGL